MTSEPARAAVSVTMAKERVRERVRERVLGMFHSPLCGRPWHGPVVCLGDSLSQRPAAGTVQKTAAGTANRQAQIANSVQRSGRLDDRRPARDLALHQAQQRLLA